MSVDADNYVSLYVCKCILYSAVGMYNKSIFITVEIYCLHVHNIGVGDMVKHCIISWF